VREVDGAALVVLDSAERTRSGIVAAPLRGVTVSPEMTVAGAVVPEPERVATVRAPLTGRLTVPAGARWPRLGARVAAGVALAQVSDARPVTSPIGGSVTRVGAQPGELVEAGQTLLEVTDNSRPVVRLAWPADAGASAPPALELETGEPGRRVPARLLGPAAEADPLTRRPVYLYRAERGWPGSVSGAAVVAVVPRGAAAQAGVAVPDSAVVQWEGLAWVYVVRRPGAFARVRVPTGRPIPGGWLAGRPLRAGDSVVVVGAEQLLSEEFRSRVTVGEEVGE